MGGVLLCIYGIFITGIFIHCLISDKKMSGFLLFLQLEQQFNLLPVISKAVYIK